AAARRLHLAGARPPEVAGAVVGDGAQPAAEGADPARMTEGRQVLDDGEQDLLDQVIHLGNGDRLVAQPADEEGAVEGGEGLPGVLVAGLGTQQQTLSGNVHSDFNGSTVR